MRLGLDPIVVSATVFEILTLTLFFIGAMVKINSTFGLAKQQVGLVTPPGTLLGGKFCEDRWRIANLRSVELQLVSCDRLTDSLTHSHTDRQTKEN